jgi:hypothetical protein
LQVWLEEQQVEHPHKDWSGPHIGTHCPATAIWPQGQGGSSQTPLEQYWPAGQAPSHRPPHPSESPQLLLAQLGVQLQTPLTQV